LLISWLAGRVEAVDEEGLDIHVARVDPTLGPRETGLMRLTFHDIAERLLDDLDPRALEAGRFVEIGRYRLAEAEDRTGIVVLSPPPITMPVDILPPDRWQTPDDHGVARP